MGIGTFVNTENELTTSALDIFSLPPVDAVLKEGKSVYYFPLNALTDSGPYEFVVPKDPDSWTCLPQTRIEGEIMLSKKDATAIATTDNVGLVNLFPQTLFKQIEIEVNGVQVCDLSTPSYPWKCFIETQLTYSIAAKSTHLLNSMYLKDSEGKESLTDGGNTGAINRYKKLNEGKFFFSIIIHSDFFQSQKLLLPNTEIKLKLIRNEDDFSILAPTAMAGKLKIEMKSLKISMRRIKIDPTVHLRMEQNLSSTNAYYDITQSKIKHFNIPTGTTSYDFQSILQGNLPRTVIFGFLDNKSYTGAVNGNPFHFHHRNINYFNLKVNGSPVVPTPFTPDFENGNYAREYRHFLDNMGIHHENETNGITKTEYINNSCFWPFDLTPDQCNGFHNHQAIQGSMDLSIAFKSATTEATHMLVYGCFYSVITIDKFRNISLLE